MVFNGYVLAERPKKHGYGDTCQNQPLGSKPGLAQRCHKISQKGGRCGTQTGKQHGCAIGASRKEGHAQGKGKACAAVYAHEARIGQGIAGGTLHNSAADSKAAAYNQVGDGSGKPERPYNLMLGVQGIEMENRPPGCG